MKTKQLNHEETQLAPQSLPFVLVCDRVNSPANAGSLFRLADALGIEHIYFCQASLNFESTRLKRTARSSEKQIAYTAVEDAETLLLQLKNEGFSCIGLELTTQSIPLETFKHQAFEKIALVLGNERHGIDQRILEQLDYLTYIPMHGKNSSMNVSQAAAIAAYQLLNAPKHER